MKTLLVLFALSLIALPARAARPDLLCSFAVALKGTRTERTQRWMALIRGFDRGLISELPPRLPYTPLSFSISVDDAGVSNLVNQQKPLSCRISMLPSRRLEIQASDVQASQVLRLILQEIAGNTDYSDSPEFVVNVSTLTEQFKKMVAEPLSGKSDFAQRKRVTFTELGEGPTRTVISVQRLEQGQINFVVSDAGISVNLHAIHSQLNEKFARFGLEEAQEIHTEWKELAEGEPSYHDRIGHWLSRLGVENDVAIRYQIKTQFALEAKRIAVRRWWEHHVYQPLLLSGRGSALLRALHYQIQEASSPADVESLALLARLIGAWPGPVSEKSVIVGQFEEAYRQALGREKILLSLHAFVKFRISQRMDISLDADWGDQQRFFATVTADGSLELNSKLPTTVRVKATPLGGFPVSQSYQELLLQTLKDSLTLSVGS